MIATALTVAIIVLGVGQLVLPPLAEHVARQRLAKNGKVLSVTVSAFPAVELLWGDAHSVNVRMANYRASQSQVASGLGQISGISNLHVRIGEVDSGRLKISAVTMTKRGSQLAASGHISDANLRAVVPLLQRVTAVSSADGQVTLQGTTDDLPLIGRVSADVDVGASGGRVMLAATGLAGALLHFTVWSDPRVYVEALSGRPTSQGLALSARARVR